METDIRITITLIENDLWGKAQVMISQWDGAKLLRHATPWQGVAAVKPMDKADNVYPYVIAALRAVTDQSLGDMLDKFGRSEVLLMTEYPEHHEILRVSALSVGCRPAMIRPS